MKRQGLSPVLVELLVVVLFFSICASINVRMLARADSLSRQSERQSAALIAATNLCERIRQDPAGMGKFDDEGLCTVETTEQGLLLRASIQKSPAGQGMYYSFEVLALEDGAELAALKGGSYLKGGAP